MRFGAARGWAGAGAAFYRHHVARARDAFETREHVEQRAHVGWLFLYPDDVAGVAVAGEFGSEFFFWKGIELFQKYNRGAVGFSLLTLGLEFMADFPGADQDAVGLADLLSGITFWKLLRVKSAMGEDASGWRSMLFGVNTTSGLRQWRSA